MKNVIILKSRMDKMGGAEKYTLHLAKAFSSAHCPVTVLTSEKSPSLRDENGIRWVSVTKKKLTSFQDTLSFDSACREWVRKEGYEILLGLDRNSFQTHLRASNGVHKSYLHFRSKIEPWHKQLSFYLNPLHRLLLKVEKRAFTDPNLKTIIVNSHLVKDEIFAHYPVAREKITVIHNGVEWQEMEPFFLSTEEGKLAFAKEHGLDPSLFYFLFIGHNYARKGLIPLLKGLSHLKSKDFHLLVVGKEKNLDYFKAITKKLKLEHQVTFFGNTNTIFPFYQCADSVVIPSYYDPFANVTLEALAMGDLVLSSKTNGGSEILNNENGLVFPSLFDTDSVTETLQEALKRPKTKPQALKIRESIRHLDFSTQLPKIVSLCLN